MQSIPELRPLPIRSFCNYLCDSKWCHAFWHSKYDTVSIIILIIDKGDIANDEKHRRKQRKFFLEFMSRLQLDVCNMNPRAESISVHTSPNGSHKNLENQNNSFRFYTEWNASHFFSIRNCMKFRRIEWWFYDHNRTLGSLFNEPTKRSLLLNAWCAYYVSILIYYTCA